MSRELDLDRLADYTAGVLDVRDADDVAELVATDPQWARAHAALIEADRAVRADLRNWSASQVERMPADVAARLDAALVSAGTSMAGARSAGGLRPVASLDRARQRRRRTFAGLAAAAAAVVAVVGGLSLAGQVIAPATSDSAALGGSEAGRAGAPSAPPGVAGEWMFGAITSMSSNANYDASTLGRLLRAGATTAGSGTTSRPSRDAVGEPAAGPGVPQADRQKVGPPLVRLTDPRALQACLTAVVSAHPGTPTLVDYARYEGTPALLILVRSPDESTVVVVGADCGIAGADEITSAVVG